MLKASSEMEYLPEQGNKWTEHFPRKKSQTLTKVYDYKIYNSFIKNSSN